MKNKDIGAFYLRHQQQELNSSVLYERIARRTKNDQERETLLAIARDERKHAAVFERYSGRKLRPNRLWVSFHIFIQVIFGYTFMLRLLERAEDKDIGSYRSDIERIPELRQILEEEEVHEKKLADILDEERLRYAGDMVLGMNDALVELTGALAGYTFAMQNAKIIAMAGLITGIAATLSMTASGYLSSREEQGKNAVKSSIYTGFAYLITVALLIIPFLLSPAEGFITALVITIVIAVSIIAVFNYYLSVAKERSFKKSFFTMAAISLGVAAVSFAVGLIVKNVMGIDL